MKKILTIIPVLALAFVFSASATLAFSWPQPQRTGLTITNKNIATTFNDATANANTGENKVIRSGGFFGEATILSGDAESQAVSEVNANSSEVSAAAPTAGETTISNSNHAFTRNNATANANTGKNLIVHSFGNALIGTGSTFAGSSAMTMVNSSIINVNH